MSNGRFKPGEHWRPHQVFREKEWLEREYAERERSAADIAKDFGVTPGAINYWMRRYGIQKRSAGEARRLSGHSVSGHANGMFGKTGSLNPNYVDGSSVLRRNPDTERRWRVLRATVLSRDGKTCRRCGCAPVGPRSLCIHHVKRWAGNPDERFNPDNVVTLCKACHAFVHSAKNTTGEFLCVEGGWS